MNGGFGVVYDEDYYDQWGEYDECDYWFDGEQYDD